MKNRFTSAVMTAVMMAMSPGQVWARASVPGNIDLNGGKQKPPAKIGNQVCSAVDQRDGMAITACRNGVDAAESMASRFAANQGQLLGCMDGLQQGLWQGYMDKSEPTAAQVEEQKKILSDVTLNTAVKRGTDLANSQGSSLAESEIITRFRDAVNNGGKPNKAHDIPTPQFPGFKDGYVTDKANDFQDVYQAGWGINEKSDLSIKLEGRVLRRLYKSEDVVSKLCKGKFYIFENNGYRDLNSSLSFWDYFKARGQYEFKNYRWNDTSETWSYFLSSVNDSPDIVLPYKQMKGQTQTVENQVDQEYDIPGSAEPILGPDGKQLVDRDGKLVFGPPKKGTRKVGNGTYREEPVPGRGPSYYQAIFKNGFEIAYKEHLMTAYFRNAFIDTFNSSLATGEELGKSIGLAVAVDKAQAQAYNQEYDKQSSKAYTLVWNGNYESKWNTIWGKFENQAQVEINSVKVIGTDSRNIFMPKESIRAAIGLTNLGGVKDNVTVSMSGPLLNASSSHTFELAALTEMKTPILTPALAQLGNLAPQTQANIVMNIRGTKEYSNLLLQEKGDLININEEAEIIAGSQKISMNVNAGTGMITFKVNNPSDQRTSAIVDLVAKLGLHGDTTVLPINFLDAGQTKSVSIPLDELKLDPLSIIEDGIQGQVSTLVKGRTLHTANVSFSVPSVVEAKAQYFLDLLVNPQTAKTGTQELPARVIRLTDEIINATGRDLDNGIEWKEPSVVARTLLGKVADAYTTYKANGKITTEVQQTFDNLASILNSEQMTNRGSVFKMKAYRAILNKISPTVKIQKKNK